MVSDEPQQAPARCWRETGGPSSFAAPLVAISEAAPYCLSPAHGSAPRQDHSVNKTAGGLLIALLLTRVASVSAQLPPEILLDQLLLRAERLVEADDLDPAAQALERAISFATEQDLELPPDVRFDHARVALAVGLLEAAKASVTEYLTVAGREGDSYEAAVALLEDVDRILERRDAPNCDGQPEGSPCWTELAHQPGCFVWNESRRPPETATWTGACSSGFASGTGTLTWEWPPDNRQEHEGEMRLGRHHGHWNMRFERDNTGEGPYRFGKRHGDWLWKYPDGQVESGPYVDDKQHGHWVIEPADGGRREGPYVDGKEHGHWVQRFADGNVGEGPYADGERNGHWIWTYPDGQVESGPYVDGEQHGRWRVSFPDGVVEYIEFVRGVRREQ